MVQVVPCRLYFELLNDTKLRIAPETPRTYLYGGSHSADHGVFAQIGFKKDIRTLIFTQQKTHTKTFMRMFGMG